MMRSALFACLFLTHVASATVVGFGTPSSCTETALQEALQAGGTITFNCGGGAQTIAFHSTLAVIPNYPPLVIDGNDSITFDGTGNTNGMIEVFGSVAALSHVTFKRLVIANGNITTGLGVGGAIQNFGDLTLDHVTVRNNHASGAGAIFQELCNGCPAPALYVTGCLFQNNITGGGTISIRGGTADIEQSTFLGNSAPNDGAIQIYGDPNLPIDATIANCTFIGNFASSYSAGAIGIEMLDPRNSVHIVNDTFTGNNVATSGHGTAIYAVAGQVDVTNCTIAGNLGGNGGAAVFAAPSTLRMDNTIIASNSGGNCLGGSFAGGHNLQFGDSTCTGATVANPLLLPLADNDGTTQTMALGAGSPAIDAGDATVAPPADQRGVARTDGNFDGRVLPDIGSYEAPGGPGYLTPPRHRAVKP